jgi:hypothetical protein
LLRLSFWIGAIVDALVAVELLLPELLANIEGLSACTPNSVVSFALGTGAALMFGWTVLLI